jgi:hypothetical protein
MILTDEQINKLAKHKIFQDFIKLGAKAQLKAVAEAVRGMKNPYPEEALQHLGYQAALTQIISEIEKSF